MAEVVKGILKLVVQAMEQECFKQINLVSRNLSDCLIRET